MSTTILKYFIVLITLFFGNMSFSQTSKFEASRIDKGNNSNLEMFVAIDDKSFIIIEKTTTKPMGLKPYLYSFDSDIEILTSEQISGYKHMEIYKKFWTEGMSLVVIDSRYFNIIVTYHKQKTNNHIFSVDLQEINIKTLKNIGNPIRIIDNEETTNDGRFFFDTSNNHFAIVKSGQTSSTFLTEGEGADVFVFNSNSFELSYRQSISLSSQENSGNINSVLLDKNGDVLIVSIVHDKKAKPYNNNQPLDNVLTSNVSKEGVVKMKIESASTMNIVPCEVDKTHPFLCLLGLNEDKSKIRLTTHSTDQGSPLGEIEISLSEIMSIKNANFTEKFVNTSQKSDKLLVTVAPLKTSISKVTTSSGNTLVSYPIMIAPPKALGFNNLFTTLVVLIDSKGDIKWVQALPVGETLLSLMDNNNDVHIFANGLLNEYKDGNYVGDNVRGVNEDVIPVEIILNGETGAITSNSRFEGIPEKNAFSFFLGGIHFDGKNGFIGYVGQNGQNSLNSRVNNDITFGHLKILD